jgi:hypothetical protein
MGLSADELAGLRDATESWFDCTCDLYRVAGADDVYGGRSRDHGPNPTIAGLPCTVDPGAGQDQERLTLGGVTEIEVFIISLPALTDVQVGDHLRVHKSGEELHVYVRAVMAPESYEIERRVVCTEVGATAPH